MKTNERLTSEGLRCALFNSNRSEIILVGGIREKQRGRETEGEGPLIRSDHSSQRSSEKQ